MAVKELFAKHGVENAELIAEVEGLLTAAESKKTDGIPYTRFKEKVEEVNNLKADLAEKETELAGLKTKADDNKKELTRLKGIETQFTEYKTAEQKKILDSWNVKAKVFDVKDADPNSEKIEKIKSKFRFPAKDEQLTAEQAQHNLEVFQILEDTGYFGEGQLPAGDTPPAGTPPTKKFKDPLDALDKK